MHKKKLKVNKLKSRAELLLLDMIMGTHYSYTHTHTHFLSHSLEFAYTLVHLPKISQYDMVLFHLQTIKAF